MHRRKNIPRTRPSHTSERTTVQTAQKRAYLNLALTVSTNRSRLLLMRLARTRQTSASLRNLQRHDSLDDTGGQTQLDDAQDKEQGEDQGMVPGSSVNLVGVIGRSGTSRRIGRSSCGSSRRRRASSRGSSSRVFLCKERHLVIQGWDWTRFARWREGKKGKEEATQENAARILLQVVTRKKLTSSRHRRPSERTAPVMPNSDAKDPRPSNSKSNTQVNDDYSLKDRPL
jgi:hypothetical protein